MKKEDLKNLVKECISEMDLPRYKGNAPSNLRAVKLTARPERVWINSPSTTNPYHKHHGKNGLGVKFSDDSDVFYFVDGDISSMEIDPIYLSYGWK